MKKWIPLTLTLAAATLLVGTMWQATGQGVSPIGPPAFAAQAANKVYAGPASGAAALPVFRLLAFADIPQLPAVNTTTVGNTADTNEDTLMTATIPAGTLLTANTAVSVKAWGACAANADTKTLRWYLGATALGGSAPSCNGISWRIEYTIGSISSSSQTTTSLFYSGAAIAVQNTASAAVSITGATTVKITCQASVGNANDCVENGMTVEPL